MCEIQVNLDNLPRIISQYAALCPNQNQFTDALHAAIGRMCTFGATTGWAEVSVRLHYDGEILGIYRREDGTCFVMGAVYRGNRTEGDNHPPEWTFHS